MVNLKTKSKQAPLQLFDICIHHELIKITENRPKIWPINNQKNSLKRYCPLNISESILGNCLGHYRGVSCREPDCHLGEPLTDYILFLLVDVLLISISFSFLNLHNAFFFWVMDSGLWCVACGVIVCVCKG